MKITEAKAHYATIFMAGDIDMAKHQCAHYCRDMGLCVTVTATEFIYTGGRETGFAIGLVNYPRFPAEPENIDRRATELATWMIREMAQDSALIQTPDTVVWITRREEPETSPNCTTENGE